MCVVGSSLVEETKAWGDRRFLGRREQIQTTLQFGVASSACL